MWRQDYATEITRKLMKFLEFIDGFFALAANSLSEAKQTGRYCSHTYNGSTTNHTLT